MSNPVRAQKRRGSVSNSGEVSEEDRAKRAAAAEAGGGPVLVPPPFPVLHFRKRGYIPIIILVISGMTTMSALKRFGVLHTTTGWRRSRCRRFCSSQNDPNNVVAFISHQSVLDRARSGELVPSLSLSAWSDPKVTLLPFMVGICGKSLTSLYLPTPRFELPPPLGAP